MLIRRRKKQIVHLREIKLDHRIIWTSTRRPVFRVSDHTRLKPIYRTQLQRLARMLEFGVQQVYQLYFPIRLRGCVGWSEPLTFACSYVRFSLNTVHKYDNVYYEINQAGVIIVFQCFHTLPRSVN